uniref:Hermansky-Pudlak syndrome 5 protein homolog n=1 Tax=Electrophorus electricus TaxID=8005 RepID=A0A4W4GN77_ELEEL
ITMIHVVPETCTHVLAEFDCLDPLLSVLRLDSGRLKCTCLAASRKWLALGNSAGGLHIIQRDGWKQRLILTHKEGSITQVACCPHNEDFIAVATSDGAVVVWDLQVERRGRPERACVSWEHRGQTITALCWDTLAVRVFIGDAGGKVSFVRAGSSKLGKGSGFVLFPVQTITTVDSRVVQLGYLEGRLLVSSLSRCYLCDTEREKFWRVGNKERDGEYGACFLPQQQAGLRGQTSGAAHLLYCARPGSRVWEASFDGEVLSTHQFKQLLTCPALPLISSKYVYCNCNFVGSPQSLAFSRLLSLSDQHLLTWTHTAIYIFTPQSGQVLLWTVVKGEQKMAVFRNELFCLHGSGHLSHLSLLPVERCVERLMKRESWTLAATVCYMFQHAITTCKARKAIPLERLEYLKAQLSSTSQQQKDLIDQLEDVISKLEPMDSACSSRRSSISSHESFSVMDSGIYRVISRRSSQSDDDNNSLISQSLLEEERMKEFNFTQEEEQGEHGKKMMDRGQRKTTEKINTLQMNSDLWPRPDHRDGGQGEATASMTPYLDEVDMDMLTKNKSSSQECVVRFLSLSPPPPPPAPPCSLQIQDPSVLLDPACLEKVLLEWVPVLKTTLAPEDQISTERKDEKKGVEKRILEMKERDTETQPSQATLPESDSAVGSREEADHFSTHMEGAGITENNLSQPLHVAVSTPLVATVKLQQPLPSDLQNDLSRLACLYMELGCPGGSEELSIGVSGGLERVCVFLRRFFFLMDQDRVRRMCTMRYREQPDVLKAFISGMLGEASKVVEVIQKGELLKSLRCLRDLQPWNSPVLLSHLYRLYERHGEVAVRAYPQFYPTVLPSDIMAMVEPRHFLPYLDNLVQSQTEEQRLSFLGSLLQPETLRQDWLELALTHDAPQKDDTLTTDGHPKWHAHYFCWGYGRLLSMLIRLPADVASKQKMLESCRLYGYWLGYLYLCNELQRRSEAFSAICRLDDMSLLEEPDGTVPQTMEEWMLLIQLCQQHSNSTSPSNSATSPLLSRPTSTMSVEKVTLRLARVVGSDRALAALQECGLQLELSPHSTLVWELLKVAEKRQRALIQTMLERCDRFLWSQHA